MARINYFIPGLICLSFTNCVKDKLNGSFKPLTGKWHLVKSTNQQNGQISYPATADALVVEFLEKGKYFIYKNGKKTGKGYTMIEDDHVTFRAAGMEMARNEMSFKSVHTSDIHNDSLFLSDHLTANPAGYDDVYLKE